MKTDIQLQGLIEELKKQDVKLWKRIASDLEKPTRQHRVVNLYRINKFTKENEVVIVPGKVLGTGDIDHQLTIAALNFSRSAVRKLLKNKSTLYSIFELLKNNPEGKKVRIIG